MVNNLKAVAYVRTATDVMGDGCKLNVQMEAIKRYAEVYDIDVVATYCDKGKSGCNVEGCPEFMRLMNDITLGEVKAEYVLVSKLSRFGRNATSVYESLQKLQSFGVNLICTEDRLNTSEGSGRLLGCVLSVMSEFEKDFSAEYEVSNSTEFEGGEW